MADGANTNMSDLSEQYAKGITTPEANQKSVFDTPMYRAEHHYRISHRAHQLAKEAHVKNKKPYVAPLTEGQKHIIAQQQALSGEMLPNQGMMNRLLTQEFNLPGAAQPWFDKFATPEQNEVARLMHQHSQHVLDPLAHRTRQMWEEMSPSINAKYALQGNFYGGHRLKAQEEAKRKLLENMHMQGIEALGKFHPEALSHIHATRGQHLQGAQIAADLQAKQGAENRAQTAALQEKNAAYLRHKMAQLGAGEHAGFREQEQRQRELNEEAQVEEAARQHPWKQVEREAAISGGLPIPVGNTTYVNQPAPPSPNAWQMGAAALPQAAQMMQQPQGRKKGGHIKRHYADGGQLPPMMDKYLPAMHNAEVLGQQQLAQGLQNTHPNAANQGLGLMGATMGSEMSGPFGAFSRGNKARLENEQGIQESRYGHQKEAALIMDKIQSSRIDQQKMLIEHQKNLRTEAEAKRLHDAQIRHLDANTKLAGMKAGEGGTNGLLAIGEHGVKPKMKLGLKPQDLSQLKEIEKHLQEYEVKKQPYKELLEFSEQENPDTGLLASITPNVFPKAREYGRRLNKVITSEMPAGVMTKAKLEFTKAGKPTELDTPEAVREFSKKGLKAYESLEEGYNLAREYAAYDIPPRITLAAYEQWQHDDAPEGEFENYLAAILEGKGRPDKRRKDHQVEDFSKMPEEELLRIAGE